MGMVKFSVVTPCLNPGHLLPETVESILGQRAVRTGRVHLEYVIVDGGSTDGTRGYLESLVDPRVTWVSEPDKGMYDALAKGLERLSGDVHSYLNAGDLYHPHAFDVVADAIGQTDGWLTGMAVKYNERGDVVAARTPAGFRSEWFRKQMYDERRLKFLQQESTFWASDLTATLDLGRLRSFRLAGDAYLWATFSRHAHLMVVGAHLGGFRLHGSQLSDDLGAYWDEMASFLPAPSPADRVRAGWFRFVDTLPVRLKHRLSDNMLVWRDGWV